MAKRYTTQWPKENAQRMYGCSLYEKKHIMSALCLRYKECIDFLCARPKQCKAVLCTRKNILCLFSIRDINNVWFFSALDQINDGCSF